MDIEIQVDEILREKGVTPPHMSQREFFEEFTRRFEQEMPLIIEAAANRINRDIGYDEMARVGRAMPCRYFWHKKKKYCNQPADCYTCLNYKPVPGWQRWLRTPKNLEFLVIGLAALCLFSALLQPPVSGFVLGVFFGLVVISRLHNYRLYKLLKEMKSPHQAKK
jgi:hypothetical protein